MPSTEVKEAQAQHVFKALVSKSHDKNLFNDKYKQVTEVMKEMIGWQWCRECKAEAKAAHLQPTLTSPMISKPSLHITCSARSKNQIGVRTQSQDQKATQEAQCVFVNKNKLTDNTDHGCPIYDHAQKDVLESNLQAIGMKDGSVQYVCIGQKVKLSSIDKEVTKEVLPLADKVKVFNQFKKDPNEKLHGLIKPIGWITSVFNQAAKRLSSELKEEEAHQSKKRAHLSSQYDIDFMFQDDLDDTKKEQESNASHESDVILMTKFPEKKKQKKGKEREDHWQET
ncbi:hypothetical protein DACRYDRAFT_17069 [Dacryopinax primogenitus]|uniref:Uncharacterized protein n=1 Tax=Dacryopinax primogenitus (strain DJM 731) TaxID=1858805 RepID=M5G8A9_DACPD|nr:uncharacterized protein DACRYDRAFT_17069 [Dacryopinax primogenitus]EJT99992.1 hypothetical protein DACRYDRAFT_17069 [Dacryopinax primogenitus]